MQSDGDDAKTNRMIDGSWIAIRNDVGIRSLLVMMTRASAAAAVSIEQGGDDEDVSCHDGRKQLRHISVAARRKEREGRGKLFVW